MQMLGYHNHNFFCDGEESPEKYVQEAVKQGFKAIGFSSHAPFDFYNKWSIGFEKLNKYVSEIKNLKTKYADDLDVLCSLEIDYAPGKIKPFDFFRENYKLDYVIGSVHYVVHPVSGEMLFIDGQEREFRKNLNRIFNGNIRYAVKTYFSQTAEMITNEKPEIIGHIDKIIMNSAGLIFENGNYPSWYIDEIEMVTDVAASTGCIIELNLRGLIKGRWHTTFIDEKFIPLCNNKGIEFVISSDAHSPEEVGMKYGYAVELLRKNGIYSTAVIKSQ